MVMSYHRGNRGYPGVGLGDAPSDPNTLPICPSQTGGWCRAYVGAPAQYVGIFAGPSVAASSSSSSSGGASTATNVGQAIAAIFGALATKPAVPVTPILPYPQSGMSTGTKLALGAGAALLLVVLATR